MNTPESVPPSPPPPPAAAAAPAPAPQPNRKRWKKILLISGGVFVGLILVLLLLGPSIIASVARSKISALVAEQTGATATVGGVSFSWSGHIELDDFRLVPRNFSEPLVEVKKIDIHVDVGAALGGRYIAAVEVVAPKVLVEKGADGKFNYEFPPKPESPAEPKGKKEPGKPPFVQATLKVRDGGVKIRGGGRETIYQNLAVYAAVDTFDKPVQYDLSFESPLQDGLKLTGALDLSTISGPATLTLERFSLKNLTGAARAYSEVLELDGTMSGSFHYELRGAPRFIGKGGLQIDGLSASVKGQTFRLDHVNVSHDGGIDGKGSGKHTLTLESGKALVLKVVVDVKDAFQESRATAVDARMDSDLAALSLLLPGIVGLKPGTSLGGSVALVAKAETKGSTWAKVDVSLDVDNLSAVEKGTSQEIDKAIRLKTAGLWDGAKQSVSLDRFTLASAFATADATGGVSLAAPIAVRESSFQMKADLEKLGAKLGLFMADAPALAGSIAAKGSYAGDQYTLDATAKGVRIVSHGKTTGPIDATVVQKGIFSMAKDGAFRIETGVVSSSAADLKLSGEIRGVLDDRREGELKIEASARPVELSKWIADLGLGGPEIKLAATVWLKPKQITVVGQTKLDGLTMNRKDDKGVLVTKVATSGPLDFNVTMKGEDLLATLKTSSVEWADQGYAAKCGLESQVTYSPKGTTGKTTLTNLELTDDRKNVVKDAGLTIVHDIGLSDGNRTVDLRKTEVTSSFLRGTVTGRLLHLDQAPEFQKLRASFKYIPDKVTALAGPWLPGKLVGAEEKAFDLTLDGKAASADVLAILRGMQGALDVDVATFVMSDHGLRVSGRTHLDLKDGKISSATPLVLNRGKTDLHASLDFNPAERKPQSSITFSAKDVDANGQMAPILERLNPIFHTSGVDAKVDGVIQSDFKLGWTGVLDPGEKDWVAAASRSLSGSGLLGVQNLNIAGSPTVGELMSALGLGSTLQGELVATQIQLGNGQCSYENMTLRGSRKAPEILQRDQQTLAQEKQDLEAEKAQMSSKEYKARQEELRLKEDDLPFRYVLRFTGVVKFDKRMELRVLMPMTDGMVKAHPNLKKYLGSSFWVDLKGTTDHPSLDLKKMLVELAERAAAGVVKEKLDNALQGFFNRQKDKDADKLFKEAQKSETEKKEAQALQSYQRLLKDYGDSDTVRKHGAAIQERIKALGGH